MASKTEIANLAIRHLGIGKEIGNLETEKSEEAIACRRFYQEARKSTLRDFPWPFATQLANLALVSNPPTETDEWSFSYRYPPDCLMIRRIPSGVRNDAKNERIPFKLGRDTQGKLIYADFLEAKIEYTFDEKDTGRYDADFTLALSYLLAVLVAPSLTAGDPFRLGEQAQRLYIIQLTKAEASSANEEQVDPEPESELIRARDGDFLPPGQGRGRPFGS